MNKPHKTTYTPQNTLDANLVTANARLLPVLLTTGYKLKAPRTSSLGSINLLQFLPELRQTVYLLDYQLL